MFTLQSACPSSNSQGPLTSTTVAPFSVINDLILVLFYFFDTKLIPIVSECRDFGHQLKNFKKKDNVHYPF